MNHPAVRSSSRIAARVPGPGLSFPVGESRTCLRGLVREGSSTGSCSSAARSPSETTSTSSRSPDPCWPPRSKANLAQRPGPRSGVGGPSGGGKPEGNPSQTRLDWVGPDRIVAGQGRCGRDRIRTCVGNAGDFTGRSASSPRVPSHPRLVPIVGRDVYKRPVDSFSRHQASPPAPPRPARPSVRRREAGGKFPLSSDPSSNLYAPPAGRDHHYLDRACRHVLQLAHGDSGSA